MNTRLKEFSEKLEYRRAFSASKYAVDKFRAIEEFFKEENLDAVVIGLSGGVDSALVVNMFAWMADNRPNLIKKVVVLIMPIWCMGSTGQDDALRDAELVMASVARNYPRANIVKKVADLTTAFIALTNSAYTPTMDPWTLGQLVSVVRTPALYFNAAILQSEGYKSIVVGTTNRDEGSYIGFFGKASDGMVDLQPIADLHKDEVLQFAKYLQVDNHIISRKYTGDVYDGRGDEEMIGAPYWFLKIYLLSIEYNSMVDLLNAILLDENATEMIRWINNIEAIHAKNIHKYKVGLPSRFVNVLSSKIPNGWTV